jgi:hypothetical protein
MVERQAKKMKERKILTVDLAEKMKEKREKIA